MSFDVFFRCLSDSAASTADVGAASAVLAPYVAAGEPSGFGRLTTADGGADLYGYDELESGFMANRISGILAWDLLVDAAAASAHVIMPVGCPVVLTDVGSFEHLPAELRSGEVAIVRSGTQLLDLIQERVWACPVCFEPVLSARPYERWPPDDLLALTIPYVDSLGSPSYEVCPSCGFEFGFDDDPGTAPGVSFQEYREQWVDQGRPLFAGGEFMPNTSKPKHNEGLGRHGDRPRLQRGDDQ